MQPTRREFLSAAGALAGAAMSAGPGSLLSAADTQPASSPATQYDPAPTLGEPISYGQGVTPSQIMPRPQIVLPTDSLPAPTWPKKRLALLGTLWAHHTHTDNIGTPFIEGYSIIGRNHKPCAQVVSIFTDQKPAMDISVGMADRHKIPIFPTIADALTMGSGKLAVDGVLLVCENGAYPYNEKNQKLWPRRQWFEQVVKVFRDSGRVVPVYNDKFFASTWEDAQWMYRQSRELGFGMAGGSSVPVAWRLPPLAFERGIELDDALAVGYSHLEGYGYHAMELLQSFVEKRKDARGIKSVQTLKADAAWQAARDGLWSEQLLRSALSRTPLLKQLPSGSIQAADPQAEVILIQYADGLRACVYMSRGLVESFAFAAKVKGRSQPVSTWTPLTGPQRDHFKFLCNHIEVLMRTGQPSMPIERTYLVTGGILAAVDSAFYNRPIDTQHLAELTYEPSIW